MKQFTYSNVRPLTNVAAGSFPAYRRSLVLAGLTFTSLCSGADYDVASYSVAADGQFTVSAGYVHYWQASTGYNTYNLATGVNTTYGLPENGTNGNGYGDAFGVYDASSGLFYGASYGSSGSDIYVYDTNTSSWGTSGPAGIQVPNTYGAATYSGKLYASGLNEPWDGAYGQDSYIYDVNVSGALAGAEFYSDMLIQTSGNSASVAVDSSGNVYYIPFSMTGSSALYMWEAALVDSVRNDVANGELDTFLTLDDEQKVVDLNGAGNGITVDEAGHVFFTMNMTADGSVVGMYDPSSPGSYEIVYTADDPAAWLGALSIDGNFLEGDSLYFSPWGTLMGITQVPEPAATALGVLLFLLPVMVRRRR